jgi:hypothetical protein
MKHRFFRTLRRETYYQLAQHPTARMAKAGVGLTAVAALGYVIAVAVEHGGPWLNLASSFALESQMVAPEAATDTRDADTSGGTASAAVARTEAAPGRDFDYFPDHYRNQAKEPAEPIDTF